MLSETFVFVPSYNHAPFIEECLRSIISQTLQPIKLLVIDDGSKDDSPAIIEKVLVDCPFEAELIVRENRGLCRTLNDGFASSTGKYFAYLGSDDFWLPGFLAERARLLSFRENAVLAYGHSYLVDDEGKTFGCTSDYNDDWSDYADGDPGSMLINGVSPVSSSVCYRRSALENVSWNENARLEDYELYVRLMGLGEFAFDPQVLSVWRHHSYNTSKNLLLMHDEVIAAQDRNFDVLGISRDDLLVAQSETRFRYTRELLQHGEKRAALHLLKLSWRNVGSPRHLGKPLIQLLLPKSLLRSYQERKRRKMIRRYDKLDR